MIPCEKCDEEFLNYECIEWHYHQDHHIIVDLIKEMKEFMEKNKQ